MNLTEELRQIFENLESDGVKYCVARNYEFVYGSDPGRDVDVTFLKKDKKKLHKNFLGQSFFKSNTNYGSNHLVYSKYIESAKRFISIHVHLGGVSGPDIMHYKAEKLIKNSKREKGFVVPTDTYLFFGVAVHVLMDRGRVQTKYRTLFEELCKKNVDFDLVAKELKPFVYKPEAIIEKIKNKDYKYIEKNLKNIKKKYYSKNRLKKLRFYFLSGMWFFTRFKSHTLVSIIGMDGTGKSTLIDNINSALKQCLIKRTLIYLGRGKNNILPIQFFASNKYKKLEKKEEKENFKNIEKFNLLRTLSAPVFACDIFLRYFFRVLPKLKYRDIVITDRYTTDILLMKGVPWWIRKSLYFTLPKPKRTIYLYNTPEILAKRKDHPIQDLIRQEKIFYKISKVVKLTKIKSESKNQTFEEAIRVMGRIS
jgi:thymidylate kinase